MWAPEMELIAKAWQQSPLLSLSLVLHLIHRAEPLAGYQLAPAIPTPPPLHYGGGGAGVLILVSIPAMQALPEHLPALDLQSPCMLCCWEQKESPFLTNHCQSQTIVYFWRMPTKHTAIPTEQSMTLEPQDDGNGKQEHEFPISDPEALEFGIWL